MSRIFLYSTDDHSGEAFRASVQFRDLVAYGLDESDAPLLAQRFEDASGAVEAASERGRNEAGIVCIRGIYSRQDRGTAVAGQVFIAEGQAHIDIVNPYIDTEAAASLATELQEAAELRGADVTDIYEHAVAVND